MKTSSTIIVVLLLLNGLCLGAESQHPHIIFVMADDGWAIFARRGGTPLNRFGAHGYDNQAESMQGLFVAAGPAIKRGMRIDRYRSVDVYELICRILGVTPNKNDGDPRAAAALLR